MFIWKTAVESILIWKFIHSSSLSYDRSKAFSKASSPHSVIQSFFKWEYPLLSLRSSSSFLRLLPRLPVASNSPFIFPSVTRCRRQFLREMWPIQFAFCLCISCRIFLCSLALSNTSSFLTWSVQLIFSILLQEPHCYENMTLDFICEDRGSMFLRNVGIQL